MGQLLHFKKKKNFRTKKNFYVAIFACLAAVGIASWTTYDGLKNYTAKKNMVPDFTQNELVQDSEREANNGISGIKLHEENESKKILNKTDHKAIKTDSDHVEKKGIGNITYPCSKEIIKEYSPEVPLYSKTFDDWRVHTGVDFGAPQGSKVKSVADGTITELYTDPFMGTTIVIDHNGQFVATYSGLEDQTLVNKGDRIKSGQEIASIGEVPSEKIDGPHLHFSIKKENKFINPKDILG